MIEWSEEAYLEALYRHVLRRAPDPDGFASHLSRFTTADQSGQAERLLQIFLHSDEAAHVFAEQHRRTMFRRHGSSQAEGGFIISLGTHCYTASMLKRWGLKLFSGPFDWGFSTPAMIAHCLADRFHHFLDTAWYEPIPLESRPDPTIDFAHHRFYRDAFSLDRLFVHRDPTSEVDYAYLRRCVDRLEAALASPCRKLFLSVCWPNQFRPDDYTIVIDALRKRTINARLLVFMVDDPDSGRIVTRMTTVRSGADFQVVRVEPVSPLGGTNFSDTFDELAIAKAIFADKGYVEPMGVGGR